MAKSRLTVLFEDPFWIGLYEREDAGRYEVCKITFGAEPKDCEVYEYLLTRGDGLQFSRLWSLLRQRRGASTPSGCSGRSGSRRGLPASERKRSRR